MKYIDNEIYNILDGAIVRRRKSIVIPMIMLALGIVAFVGGFVITDGDLSFGLMLCGVIVALSGGAMVLMRTTGQQFAPYYTPTKEPLRRREIYYPYSKLELVREALSAKRHPESWGIESVESSNLKMVCYEAPKGGVCFCQIQMYIPHEYSPIGEIVQVNHN
jgi:hypothetical protein